jgi:hypothetical protein
MIMQLRRMELGSRPERHAVAGIVTRLTRRPPWCSWLALLLLGPLAGSLRSETADLSRYKPGKSYFGHGKYVEYLAGDMPLIISAPHGGKLSPSDVPDRKQGEFASDTNVEELARAVYQAFHKRLGHHPHVIICRLVRRKVDCNRDITEGAGDNPEARLAWSEFQQFIDVAKSNVLASAGEGVYIDLHGQSHPIKRIELGYNFGASTLTNADKVLDGPDFADRSTIRALAHRAGVPFSELLRGTNSLGGLLAAKGYPAVPSPSMPDPGAGNPFFGGGPNTRRHGSMNGGAIDGVQMEVNLAGVRDSGRHRKEYALALAEVLRTYFKRYYDIDLSTGAAAGSK